jgi:hypothetical protein
MPVATISPNVGMAHGPRCKKGIMFGCQSDSFGSIHDTTSTLGVPERKGRPKSKADHLFDGRWRSRSGTAMENGADQQPYGQGYPFGESEVAGKGGD